MTTTTQKILDLLGTPIEALAGGIAAHAIPELTKNVYANFAISAALGGGPAFAFLSTVFKFWHKYEKSSLNKNLKFSTFLKNNAGDMAKHFISIYLLGSTAFSSYLMSNAALQEALGQIPADVIASIIGTTIISVGACLPTLKLPPQKIAEICGVFAGFSFGAWALGETLTVATGAAAKAAGYLMPAAGGAVGALFFGGGAKMVNSFWNCVRPKDPEKNPLIVNEGVPDLLQAGEKTTTPGRAWYNPLRLCCGK